jgi:hypothetical protein
MLLAILWIVIIEKFRVPFRTFGEWLMLGVFPLMAITSYAAGEEAANSSLRSGIFADILEVDEPRHDFAIVSMRALENGLLYWRAADRRVVLTPWSQIAEVSHPIAADTRSRACIYLGFRCPRSTVPDESD